MEIQMKVFKRRSSVSLRALALSSCAAIAMTTALGGGVALAQDGASGDRIVVTGSRIGRSELTSVSPITVVGADDLNVQAVRTLEDFADQITFAPGGETNSRMNNGSGGQATISLRGLGPNRTLVLVNGRRTTPANTGGTADLNMIPVSLIGRVEVLRDGASTVYGSDAIAGVVNIITRDDVEGFEAFAQYDVTGEGDGQIYRYGATFGRSFDGGRFTANIEYFDRGNIRQGDRPYAACPLGESGGQVICAGSGTAYPGQIFPSGPGAVFNVNGGGGVTLDPATNTLRPFTPADGFNYAERSYLVTPQEVWSGFFDAEYDIMNSDRFGQVTAFGEFMFAQRSSQQQLAPVGTFWFPLVPAFHPNNPTGENVFVARRLAELTSGRYFTQDASSWRSVFGLEGMLPAGIFWDTSLSYGRYVDARVVDGQANPVRAAQVLCNDPASLAAGACQTPANLIWDPFRTGTLSDTIANYFLLRHSPVSRQTRLSFQANMSGDLGGLQLPGGEIGWAVGYERRRDTGEFIPDGAAQIGQIYFVSGNSTQGEQTSSEFYGEIRLPILSGVEFAELLAVELSARSSSYDVTGTNVNSSFDSNTWAIKGEWAPNDQVRVRASFSTGFRAPSIGELFAPQAQSAISYTDPCVNYATSGVSATTIANCQADGLPGNFQLTSTQATAVAGGNSNLVPEESEGLTFGVVFTPSGTPILEDFTFSADYFSFEVTNAVGTADVNTIASQCYASVGFSDPLCALIQGPSYQVGGNALAAPFPGPGGARRSAVGVLAGVLVTNANLSTYETSGVDIGIDYSGPTFDIFASTAQFIAGLDITYMDSFAYQVLPGGATFEYAGAFAQDPFTTTPAGFPEISALLRMGIVGDNWQFNYVGRFIDEVTDFAAVPTNLANTAERVMYHDVQAAYDFVDSGVGLTFGVRNLANETPPYVTNYDDMNTLNQTYDTAGRYFYGRVTIRR
jgi:iron complex outermembrane receptor protein